MTEYSKLSYLARAKLAKEDLKRYEALKAEHEGYIKGLQAKIAATVVYDERKKLYAEIDALNQPGKLLALPAAPPAVVASGRTPEQLASDAQEAAHRANPHLRPKASIEPVTNEDLEEQSLRLLAGSRGAPLALVASMPPKALEAYNRGMAIMAARRNNDGPDAA